MKPIEIHCNKKGSQWKFGYLKTVVIIGENKGIFKNNPLWFVWCFMKLPTNVTVFNSLLWAKVSDNFIF
ncbi:hypothetical protein A6A20_07870 [Volucribacter amazonae]|uniref:Uncharacterized protein n=1 Tax=Volucribacter amazonae TaxID=256731 RepID=A0A9X4PDA7_9PAST|nr:hypothetical protein [Volucribacter amazonae]